MIHISIFENWNLVLFCYMKFGIWDFQCALRPLHLSNVRLKVLCDEIFSLNEFSDDKSHCDTDQEYDG
jgi:hypothetical protein